MGRVGAIGGEAEGVWGSVQETRLNGAKGSVDDGIDGIDYVVDEGLRGEEGGDVSVVALRERGWG